MHFSWQPCCRLTGILGACLIFVSPAGLARTFCFRGESRNDPSPASSSASLVESAPLGFLLFSHLASPSHPILFPCIEICDCWDAHHAHIHDGPLSMFMPASPFYPIGDSNIRRLGRSRPGHPDRPSHLSCPSHHPLLWTGRRRPWSAASRTQNPSACPPSPRRSLEPHRRRWPPLLRCALRPRPLASRHHLLSER